MTWGCFVLFAVWAVCMLLYAALLVWARPRASEPPPPAPALPNPPLRVFWYRYQMHPFDDSHLLRVEAATRWEADAEAQRILAGIAMRCFYPVN